MRSASIVFFLLIFIAGCGDNVAQVSGRVTLDSKPLPNATVLFMPIAADKASPGPGSHAKTNDKGEYTLKLMTKDVAGAVAGKHKVSIAAADSDKIPDSGKPTVQKEVVPAEYNVNSTLTFDVPAGGTTSANFDLKSK